MLIAPKLAEILEMLEFHFGARKKVAGLCIHFSCYLMIKRNTDLPVQMKVVFSESSMMDFRVFSHHGL